MSIKKIVKNFLKKKKIQSEEEYYEELFTKNTKWNTADPNVEESLRWEIIKKLVGVAKKDCNSDHFKILDLGSGRGWLTNLLANYGEVSGIEPVKPVVEYAKKMFPNINFQCGSTKDLLILNNSPKFDLIVSSEVIEHIPDVNKEEFIKDINLLLNQKGFLILTTPRQEAQKEWIKYINPNQPIEEWISENTLKEIVEKQSFKAIELQRFSVKPNENAPEIEIYQVWLFQKL
ncbi:MAG: class I SAM-dependent methyltransferase [Limnohabitans sp.]|nr:class I SAM-dependent methyltransferase [Limnohabitans sp.]